MDGVFKLVVQPGFESRFAFFVGWVGEVATNAGRRCWRSELGGRSPLCVLPQSTRVCERIVVGELVQKESRAKCGLECPCTYVSRSQKAFLNG